MVYFFNFFTSELNNNFLKKKVEKFDLSVDDCLK